MEKCVTSFELRHPPLTPEENAANESRLAKLAERQATSRHSAIRDQLMATIPPRFSTATLANWHAATHDQALVKNQLERLAQHPASLRNVNLIFSGTIGTGKDHMAIALLKIASTAGITAQYYPAKDIYLQIGEGYKLGIVRDIYAALAEPQILCLSDPLETRNWTPARAEMLSRIVHTRYDKIRATWITANLPPDKELETAAELAGADVIDRLTENCVTIRTCWESYRQRQS